jgi:hypothetical protein
LNRTSENSSISKCTGWALYASVCSRWSVMEERYHATTQNRFYPDMSYVNKNILQWRQNVSAHVLKNDKLVNRFCHVTCFLRWAV